MSFAATKPIHSDLCRPMRANPILLIMVRFNGKITVLFLGVIGLCTLVALWTTCGLPHQPNRALDDADRNSAPIQTFVDIPCIINGDYSVHCKRVDDEIFVPFTFLHKYFDIYGRVDAAQQQFQWSHSYSRVYEPKQPYEPHGVFMYFDNYNVELRDRVKCISAIYGVPISTQWSTQGWYYPTQIAQFALAHYSRNLTEPTPHWLVLEDADTTFGHWKSPKNDNFYRQFEIGANSEVLYFATANSEITLKLTEKLSQDFVLAVDLLFTTAGHSNNATFNVVLRNRDTHQSYTLHYHQSDVVLNALNSSEFHYGVGSETGVWRRLTRDLIVDLQKGLTFWEKSQNRNSKLRLIKSKFLVDSIVVCGAGALDNLTLSTSAHMRQFHVAADWFVAEQNTTSGGWAIPVRRRLANGFQDLAPGWYSAMSQGHALSVLARAHYRTGRADSPYLEAAVKALHLFNVASADGGVLANFLGDVTLPWYEEYPTTPPSFVLNGFIYGLLGVYDLMKLATPTDSEVTAHCATLFRQGVESLRRMLMMYDTGSGTTYDLRHISLGVAPNLARWDYHATHINQLLLLATIVGGDDDGDELGVESLLKRTAHRWIGYMKGRRAAHN